MPLKIQYFSLLISLTCWSVISQADVVVQATPDGGIQPRITVDRHGDTHLLYFKKRLNTPAAREGNLYYRPLDKETGRFGLPVRVSSSAFAMQTFSIARASMAISDDGRIHVMWYYPRSAEFIYSRSNPERTAFEKQRSIVENYREGIDAGGDIAALGSQVAIIWGAGDLRAEQERTMFARFSHDAGASFGQEFMISNADLGACACCSMAADYLEDNELLVAYRSAIDGIGRHMQLLTVSEVDKRVIHASYGALHELQRWEASFCPLSTNDIARDSDAGRWLVFETQGRIVQMDIHNQDDVSKLAEPYVETRQKNPSIAIGHDGSRIVVWGEGISHARGGRLNIKVFDGNGEDTGYELKNEIEITDYSFPAAAALPNGNFLVLY
ncbi:MAG: hypothetical protein CMQ41_04135 [Gammaproteobacteria bacterium]|nr:hypothetical protein [Gammaproteobacteria bacterium]